MIMCKQCLILFIIIIIITIIMGLLVVFVSGQQYTDFFAQENANT